MLSRDRQLWGNWGNHGRNFRQYALCNILDASACICESFLRFRALSPFDYLNLASRFAQETTLESDERRAFRRFQDSVSGVADKNAYSAPSRCNPASRHVAVQINIIHVKPAQFPRASGSGPLRPYQHPWITICGVSRAHEGH
jgi:hypothetical protein